jgi:hypothetical protein
VSVRPYRGSFEPVGMAHGMTYHIEPLEAQARPLRSRGHHVKYDSRRLGWPQRPVGAVDALILAAQLFSLIPQSGSSNMLSYRNFYLERPFSAVRALGCLLLVRECLCHVPYPR